MEFRLFAQNYMDLHHEAERVNHTRGQTYGVKVLLRVCFKVTVLPLFPFWSNSNSLWCGLHVQFRALPICVEEAAWVKLILFYSLWDKVTIQKRAIIHTTKNIFPWFKIINLSLLFEKPRYLVLDLPHFTKLSFNKKTLFNSHLN